MGVLFSDAAKLTGLLPSARSETRLDLEPSALLVSSPEQAVPHPRKKSALASQVTGTWAAFGRHGVRQSACGAYDCGPVLCPGLSTGPQACTTRALAMGIRTTGWSLGVRWPRQSG